MGLFSKKSHQQEKKNSTPVSNVIEQIAEQEEVELKDNYELVAVITAAIQAYLGDEVPADGLIVRSIHKVNSRRRMNA
jgi:glutaconyl-CoA/methylmalonyl-CoA decarboxylase subunit delta